MQLSPQHQTFRRERGRVGQHNPLDPLSLVSRWPTRVDSSDGLFDPLADAWTQGEQEWRALFPLIVDRPPLTFQTTPAVAHVESPLVSSAAQHGQVRHLAPPEHS